MIAGLLARDDVRGQPFHHARHSGYQRLAAGRSLAACWIAARRRTGAFALDAHAGCLALRIVAPAPTASWSIAAPAALTHPAWDAALRATAAHSTLTLADTSSAADPAAGPCARPAGAAPDWAGRVSRVAPAQETAQGWTVEATHDAYVAALRLRHERQITLSPQGLMVTGARPAGAGRREQGGRRLPFAVRFHIHPDVRVSRLEGGGILLKLPSGEGWRFRAGGGELEVEESVYLGGADGAPGRTAGGQRHSARNAPPKSHGCSSRSCA